jgi:hypothetical protein
MPLLVLAETGRARAPLAHLIKRPLWGQEGRVRRGAQAPRPCRNPPTQERIPTRRPIPTKTEATAAPKLKSVSFPPFFLSSG